MRQASFMCWNKQRLCTTHTPQQVHTGTDCTLASVTTVAYSFSFFLFHKLKLKSWRFFEFGTQLARALLLLLLINLCLVRPPNARSLCTHALPAV